MDRFPFRISILFVIFLLFIAGCNDSLKPWIDSEAPPVIHAAQRGDLDEVKQIINGDPEQMWTAGSNGRTAAEWGILNNHVQITEYLMGRGYLDGEDFVARMNRLVESCVSVYSPESDQILRKLMERGADPNAYWEELGTYPLHVAVNNLMFEKVGILAEYGGDWTLKNDRGDTPKMIAERYLNQLRDPAFNWPHGELDDPNVRHEQIKQREEILELINELTADKSLQPESDSRD